MDLEHVITVKANTEQFTRINGFGFPSQLKGLENSILDHIHKLGDSVKQVQKTAMQKLPNISQQAQQQQIQANNSVVTGRLKGSIQKQMSGDTAHIGTNLFYAKYVEHGRGPVVAKNGGVLHFFTKAGAEVFAKRVGPAAPRPYLEPSGSKVEKELSSITKMLGGLSW